MSTLDIVLPRQVPVRPPLNGGGEGPKSDPADRSGGDAFSSLLAGQKRPSSGDRDQVSGEAGAKADAAKPEHESEEDLTEAEGSSSADAMLALLASLRSQTPVAEDEITPSADEPAADAGDDAVAADPDAKVVKGRARPDKDDMAAADKPAAAPADGKAAAAATRPETVPAGTAAHAAATAAQATRTAPAQAVAQGAATAAAPRTEAPSRARTQGDDTVRTRDTAAAEYREALRALGAARDSGASSRATTSADARAEGGAGRRSAGSGDEAVSARAGQPVEVIESRRFMPSQSLAGNAQMLARSLAEATDSALSTHRAAAAQAANAAQPATGQTLHTLKLQLNPLSLGSVTAVLKLTGEELSVAIQVETGEAYRQLKDDNQAIVKAMRAQGYSVDSITVQQMTPSDRSSGQNAQQQGAQGGFQGQGSNGSGDAQSSAGQRNEGNSSGHQGGRQNGGQIREQVSHPGAAAGRADGVYL
ncbi:flagellar hook-length control protein FliK [Hoeflea olei]|uniref:Flagellar hook-length control protein-like C-terminal domain-containing protein n=1 Tax=Hoeflea olei TaxID=1480615 RepID=A0A1C1YRQ5_9HYPH|nr:flagellar hook-length control protein FliK [Hoeflea olei]OCW56183.1 hypothetical protein AWJ14_18975 [Hoeflea olei]